MYRILLADDEGIMLESLKMIFEDNFLNECELAFAKTGRAVIEQVESFRPDIVFLDIQMPGLNGISAMKEIRKTNENIIFIVITAYDQFSYAKEAVNLGAMEYLTKPVNRKVIVDVAMKAMKKVEEERKKRSDDLKIREKLEIVIPMIESGFLYNVLLQDDILSGSGNYKNLLNITEEYGFMIVTEFGDSVEEGVMTNVIGASVKASRFYNEYREIAKSFFPCIVGPVMGNRIVLLLPYSKSSISYEERVIFITKARNMMRKLEQQFEIYFRAGIGTVKSMDELKQSYQEAICALKDGEGRVIHIKDLIAEEKEQIPYPEDTERKYILLGSRGDVGGAMASGSEFFDWMVENYADDKEDIEMKVLELTVKLEQQVSIQGGMKLSFRTRKQDLKEIKECRDYRELREWFLQKTKEISSNFQLEKEKESDQTIEKAKKYIKDHLHKDISLDDVSRKVDISPYYFSKLFKQKTGENFIEYVTKMRIQYGKELLMQPEYSIKEICIKCGYSDPNYFSRIFKKQEGITPSQYRERVGIK